MSDPNSRYFGIPVAELGLRDADGRARTVRYLRRRLIPSTHGLVTMVEHRVSEGDRLDNLSARYLGDPLAFWRIADANLELQPDSLTEEPGRSIRIALPQT